MLTKLLLILSVIFIFGCRDGEPEGHIGVMTDTDVHFYPLNPGQDDQSELDIPFGDPRLLGASVVDIDMHAKLQIHHDELHIRLYYCRSNQKK